MIKRSQDSRRQASWSSDESIKRLWNHLVRDFRASLKSPNLWARQQTALRCTKQFRQTEWPSKTTTSVYIHKCQVQLETLFKRYTFEDDLKTAAVRRQETLDRFIAYQEKLATPPCTAISRHLVLQRARTYISRILGPFNMDELLEKVEFGKRANYGVPYAKSYLDEKVRTLSGSKEHCDWFVNTYLPTDDILRDAIASVQKAGASVVSDRPHLLVTSTLTATAVPKSFKIDRIITPNTVIGAMHSAALGTLIEERLKEAGLNIRKLQERQKELAQSASRHRQLVTADLSDASNCFTHEMVNRLIPRRWYTELKRGMIRHVKVGDRTIQMTSFMAMGIGYTFPLETLMFYGVLKALAELCNVSGRISVYGDDLIYPRKLHPYVVRMFPKIGFHLNIDKTFCNDNFRESCGGDYYHGVDVRPYQPEQVGKVMSRMEYLVFLYKTLNGLCRRWDPCEIPSSVHYLIREIVNVGGRVMLVPPGFPDTAGFKTSETRLPWYVPFTGPRWDVKSQSLAFPYISTTKSDRYVENIYPYYWESMRQSLQPVSTNPWADPTDHHLLRWVTLRKPSLKRDLQSFSRPNDPPLGTRASQIRTGKSPYARLGLSRKRCLRLFPVVTQKGCSGYTVVRGSASSWSLGAVCPA